MIDFIYKYRISLTVLAAIAGIGLMIFYEVCDTSCSYLVGDLFGVDLKWVGIVYMLTIIPLALFRQYPWLRSLLAAGLGAEIYLFAFQVHNDVYCPFCLVFALMVAAAFVVNYEPPSIWRDNIRCMALYFLGEVNLPMLNLRKIPLLLFVLLGYLFTVVSFSGSTTPAYGAEPPKIPTLGKGSYEVILFSDYFCPPCRRLDASLEPTFKALLDHGGVKITFVDVPFSDATPLYARYYLYAVHTGVATTEMLRIRKILFDAAQVQKIQTRARLVKHLQDQHISWKEYNVKPVFLLLNKMIQNHKIDATPACVIKYASGGEKKFISTEKIEAGLQQLQTHLGIKDKKLKP